MVEPTDPSLSITRQLELVSLPASSYYYKPVGQSTLDELLMRLIDVEYTARPYYGSRRIQVKLKQKGHLVGRRHIMGLMCKLGLQAIYPKRRTTVPSPDHVIYKYLLRGRTIDKIDEVWSCDITYIRLAHGFIYLVAVIDWASRRVLSWAVSNTMDIHFCIEALTQSLSKGTPEIFNTDQGSQFTSTQFTSPLLAAGVRISMDGRGRALDNIFIERFWRSIKYELIYLRDFGSMSEAVSAIGEYIDFYNNERPHQSLGYQTPADVYNTGRAPRPE